MPQPPETSRPFFSFRRFCLVAIIHAAITVLIFMFAPLPVLPYSPASRGFTLQEFVSWVWSPPAALIYFVLDPAYRWDTAAHLVFLLSVMAAWSAVVALLVSVRPRPPKRSHRPNAPDSYEY